MELQDIILETEEDIASIKNGELRKRLASSLFFEHGVEDASIALSIRDAHLQVLGPSTIPYDRRQEGTFYDCSSLLSVDLSQCTALMTVGDHTFYNCRSLKTVLFSSTVTRIGDFSFAKCTSLTELPLLPDSLLDLGDHDFGGCIAITKIAKLPKNLTTLNKNVFAAQSILRDVDLSTNNKLRVIGESAFVGCRSLRNVVLPDNGELTVIASAAFWKCEGIEAIELPDR